MYSCSSTFSQISLKNPLGKWFLNFGKVTIFAIQTFVFSFVCLFVFLSPILERNNFLNDIFLLIYGYFRCIQIWCKFRAEISLIILYIY